MISSHIPPAPPETKPLQITSTTFKAEGVCLGPQQLQELKALATEWDEQKTKATAEENWGSLLHHTQHVF